MEDEVEGKRKWWWKSICKLNSNLKTRIFLLLTLCNKVLNWDNCQRRKQKDLGRCILCKNNDEKLRRNITYFKFLFECFRLLADILLPSPNHLHCSYQELSLIMTYLGMEYVSIDACLNDHIIYYGWHTTKLEFPQCGSSIY